MFNAELATLISLGLIAQVIVTVGVVAYLARKNSKAIDAEVLKTNKRLHDQISSRVG